MDKFCGWLWDTCDIFYKYVKYRREYYEITNKINESMKRKKGFMIKKAEMIDERIKELENRKIARREIKMANRAILASDYCISLANSFCNQEDEKVIELNNKRARLSYN